MREMPAAPDGDDVWIPSACSLCYNQCGIRVHRRGGVVVKIEGHPESPLGMGRLCPKGLAGIMLLSDPHRLNVPLKRTNPAKGIHVDPGWVETALKPPYRLERDGHYTWEELAERIYQNYFGPERGLGWFKTHGVLRWPKRVEEAYWEPFVGARVPIYFEWLTKVGERVAAIAQSLGLHELDTSDFQPLPDWKPCAALRTRRPGFDLQAIYYRVAWHTFSMTYENPGLDEVSTASDPWSYFVSIHAATARARGIRDGDRVWVESAEAGRVKGRARLVEGIHPEVVGIASNGGHWAPGMPVARGKGVFFEGLLPLNLRALDPVGITMDSDARVRVYRA